MTSPIIQQESKKFTLPDKTTVNIIPWNPTSLYSKHKIQLFTKLAKTYNP